MSTIVVRSVPGKSFNMGPGRPSIEDYIEKLQEAGLGYRTKIGKEPCTEILSPSTVDG